MTKKTFKVWVEYESEIVANTQAEAEDIFQRLFNIHDMLINSVELKSEGEQNDKTHNNN